MALKSLGRLRPRLDGNGGISEEKPGEDEDENVEEKQVNLANVWPVDDRTA